MLEALRGLGYTAATAIADIIDNSITAKAHRVDVGFVWRGADSYITVQDDGLGMDEDQLERAMRLGERSPLDRRDPRDLGRFGLGMKTASFSQCRRLTVASRRKTAIACFRWDLDFLAASPDDGWHLLEGPASGSIPLLEAFAPGDHGTMVLWERLDRVVTPGSSQQDFLDLMDLVELHLAMVFHRFLEGARPRLQLAINGRAVRPWDPFLASHQATWSSPVAALSEGRETIVAQCHVLPHRDRLDPELHERAAGPEGWTAQQGFYVYRNERLLVPGNWLGLGQGRYWTKDEAHRLARIRVDIPNSADASWKIDIRKSTARPPAPLRPLLTRLAEDTRERARRVFAHRGQVSRVGTSGASIAQAWRVDRSSIGMRYRIDVEHPSVKAVLDDAGHLLPQVQAMLRVIEETIPVQRIWLDTAEGKETPRTGFAGDPSAEVRAILEVMFRSFVSRRGLSPDDARKRLLHTEPFNNYPDLVSALPDELPVEE